MTSFRAFAAGLALSLATCLPALAESTTAPAVDGAPAGGAIATAAPGGDLSMGAAPGSDPNQPGGGLPTQETAEVGQPYLLQSFDAWEDRCLKTADGADPCHLYQLLKDSTGNPVAEFTLFALPDGQPAVAGASVVAPLETLLTKNLGIAIDGAEPKVYPFAFCTKDGCVAKVGFTADEVAALKKGTLAKITIVPAAAPDKAVVVDVSLKGFTAGYEAVAATRPKK